MGKRAEEIAAGSGLNSCQAHNVGISPQENRGGTKGKVGKAEGTAEEEIGGIKANGHAASYEVTIVNPRSRSEPPLLE